MDKSGGHPEAAGATSVQAADHPGGGGAAPTHDFRQERALCLFSIPGYLRARRTPGSEPGQVGGGPGAYLAEDSEAWFRVQLRLFQFHHSYPAVFIQVFFVIVITQAQWVHLGNKRGESFSGQAADLRGSRSACLRRHSQKQPRNCTAYGGGERVFQPSGDSISAQ